MTDDETRPDAVTEPTPPTPPPAAPAAPDGAPTEQGDQTSAATASALGEEHESADTTNPGDDLDPDDAKLADLNPADTPNPYTGADVIQDDEAVQP